MEPFRPSAFTPFIRRFTDEKANDLRDTRALYERVRARHIGSRFADPTSANREIGGGIYGVVANRLSDPLTPIFCDLIYRLLVAETTIFAWPVLKFDVAHLSLKELVDLRHFLRAKEHFLAHQHRVVPLLEQCIGLIVDVLADQLPRAFDPSPFTIPLVYLLPEPKVFIDQLIGELWKQAYVDNGLFIDVARQLFLNLCEASGIADPYEPKKPFKYASKSDAPLHEVVKTYLKGTPFFDFFMASAPLQFTFDERFSHMHVVGGSGAGKTTLLQNLILSDLASDEPPALVIVDSQSDLIRKLSRLEVFAPGYGPLSDRFLLISPRDTKHPPALNIFDINRDRLQRYDEETKEQVVAGVIQTFDYLFEGLLGADLTAKQTVFFRFVARLMLALPETLGRSATILDMLELMENPAPYGAAIEFLPPIQRQFFQRDFLKKQGNTFAQTKDQIRYRLNAILENPTLARLFTSPETKIDLFTALNDGAIVLVDTAKDFLKGSSANFGRIFISLVLQAILERAAIPEHERRPTFLIVDEAAAYFDSNIDDLLTEARKYKLGCVFAHQFLDQATPSLRASLAANTSIKMAAGTSTGDARAMAPDMRTTADFIQSQPRLHFACHIRNVTPSAVSIPVEVGLLERQPTMSSDSFEELRRQNRERVSLPPEAHEPAFHKTEGTAPESEEAPHSNKAKDTFWKKRDAVHKSSEEPAKEEPRKPVEDPGAASEEW